MVKFHWLSSNTTEKTKRDVETRITEDIERQLSFYHNKKEGEILTVTLLLSAQVKFEFDGKIECSCENTRWTFQCNSDGSNINYQLVED